MTVDYEQIIRRQPPAKGQKPRIDGVTLWESRTPDITDDELRSGVHIVVATSPDLRRETFSIIGLEGGSVFLEQRGNRFPVSVSSITLGCFRGLNNKMHTVLEIHKSLPNNAKGSSRWMLS